MGKIVAVIGASANRRKFGNKAVRAFRDAGYTVVPINPHEQTIEGVPCFRSVLDVPGTIDMVTVYLPPDALSPVLRELAARPVGEVWLNPGADRDDVVAAARALGLHVIVACSILGVGQRPEAY
jgi:predicted CoA-binding protein